jgi:WD40 repeat protein/AcrR family transcriptional regulator
VTEFGRIRRRQLVAIATSEFDHYQRLDEVPDEVRRITKWLADKKLGNRHFTPVYPELAANPMRSQIEARLRDTPAAEQWNSADAAVIYITGHGDVAKDSTSPQHLLVLKSTNIHTNYSRTALPTVELLRWLAETSIEYLLVIIDVCFAGRAAEEILAKVKDHWLILPSALEDQGAKPGALTEAIAKYLEKAAEFNNHSRYLTVKVFVDTVNQMLADIAPGQRIKGIYEGQRLGHGSDPKKAYDQHVCLPNPAFEPRDERVETEPARHDLALRAELLEVHNRVNGQMPSARGHGWLFVGRRKLMRDLVEAISEPGITVVTGSAGCGKSTALSRLVTLSDPEFLDQHGRELDGVPPDLRPAPGAIDVALSASRHSTWYVQTQICYHLGALGEASSVENSLETNQWALSDYVRHRKTPVTIVIDALDEADDAIGLVTSVLKPLSEQHPGRLCLLLGVRSPRGPGEVDAAAEPGQESLLDLMSALGARRIPVDDGDRWEQDDLTTFIDNILTNTPNSPYRSAEPGIVAGFTEIISGVARRSYLTARVAAESLAARKAVISPDDPAWLAEIRAGLLGAFRDDLWSSLDTPARVRRFVTLLRAVAFARGNGLPHYLVWPEIARAIDSIDGAGYIYGEPDVRELLGSRLNAYLEADAEDDLTVYRLIHDELRDILLWRWRALLTKDGEAPRADEDEVRAIEAAIAAQLRATAGHRATVDVGRPTLPYIRRHLAEHALAGDVLDECVPVHFLPYVDLAALRAAVGASPARRQLDQTIPWLPVLQQISHLWDWYRPARNATAIEMWAVMNEAELSGSGREPGPVGGPWEVRWAIRPPDLGNVLGWHRDGVLAVATAELSDGPVAVTGGQDGLLSIWDLSTGARYRDREPLPLSAETERAARAGDAVPAITCVATTRLPSGRVVGVTGSADGFVRAWDLASGRALGDPLQNGGKRIEAVTTAPLPDGRVVVIAADQSGEIRTWDLVARSPVGEPLLCGPGNALGLTTALVGGQLLGLATGEDSGLQLWDVTTGEPTSQRLTDHPLAEQLGTGSVQGGRVIAAVVIDGREIVLTGNGDGLLLWDISERAPLAERLRGADGRIRTLATKRLGDLSMAVTGGDKALQLWNLATREPLGELLTGHGGSVEAVAIAGVVADSALAVSAGRDTSVRLWDIPSAALLPRHAARQIGIVESVATASPRQGGALAITCSHTLAQVWDLHRGGDPVELTGYDSPVVSVAAAELPDGVLVIGGHWDGNFSTWRAADGTLLKRGEIAGIGAAASLATAMIDGRLLAVAGDWNGTVHVWDPLVGTQVSNAMPGHADVVVAVATVATDDQRTLLVSGAKDGYVLIRDLGAHVSPGDPAAHAPVAVSLGAEVASLTVTKFADGQSCVVVGDEDGRVHLLGLLDGAALVEPWRADPAAVTAVAAGQMSDGRVAVFTGGEEGLVQTWDASTGEQISEALPVAGPVLALAYEPETSCLVVGGTGVAVARPRLGG